VSDIDTAVADSLKVLDLKRPIREADITTEITEVRQGPQAVIRHKRTGLIPGNPAFRRPAIISFAFACPPRAMNADIEGGIDLK
jgi:hypothetical protein